MILAFSLGIYLLLNVQVSIATNLDVENTDQIVPTIPPIPPICWGSTAPLLPSISTNGITGTWDPSVISTTANDTVTYVFTPDAGQNATVVKLDVVVFKVLPTFKQIGPLHLNSTAPVLPTASTNGITGTWSPATVSTTVAGISEYTFVPNGGQCAPEFKMGISVVTAIVPTFIQIGPICQNSPAPVLSTTSTNGITGTWNPSTISTAAAGTVTYTFTPTAGQSATAATLDVEIFAPIAPVFSAIGPLLQNSVAPVLSTTSINGITGTWSPATISTLLEGTTTYTFTPTTGLCAINAKLDILISNSTVPQFNVIGPLCLNSLAPVLPATSTNGITGTWSPSTINTSASGTITYIFTPAAGQSATAVMLDVKIIESSKPAFNTFGPICQNSAAPVLPTTSTNGIIGTWSPAKISTLIEGIVTYTFTPLPGQCATSATLDIEIFPSTAPVFSAIGPSCLNSAAPLLPTTSINGISGTWSPATINTLTTGTAIYTFTPTDGQCATSVPLDIEITAPTLPLFKAIGPLCQNSAVPVLPATSINGITGTWTPATISTLTAGTATYTFTPTDGQCATPVPLDIEIIAPTLPQFMAIGPLCQNSVAPVLPTISANGITGTWTPVTISTLTAGTATYTFTPTDGQCATSVPLDIEIIAPTLPQFMAIGPLCQNSTAPVLPTISANGITGTWTPVTISTLTAGTTTYTFTPTDGQCATSVPLGIEIIAPTLPQFMAIGPLCQNSTAPVLPTISANGIIGTWSPATISTSVQGTTTYTFTPAAGQCATSSPLDIEILPPTTPVFSAIGPLDLNSVAAVLSTTSTNGITGTWSPTIISTLATGTTKYSFIPTDGQCAVPANLDIVVEEPLKAGVELIRENELKIYPNPMTHTMWVENIDQSKLWDMTILSISGEKIKSYKISSAKTEIDVSKLTSGVYFFQFENTKERVVRKVLKE
jgi:hypothetical protein